MRVEMSVAMSRLRPSSVRALFSVYRFHNDWADQFRCNFVKLSQFNCGDHWQLAPMRVLANYLKANGNLSQSVRSRVAIAVFSQQRSR